MEGALAFGIWLKKEKDPQQCRQRKREAMQVKERVNWPGPRAVPSTSSRRLTLALLCSALYCRINRGIPASLSAKESLIIRDSDCLTPPAFLLWTLQKLF